MLAAARNTLRWPGVPAVAGWLTKSSATGLRMLVGDAGVSAHGGPKLTASTRMGVQQGGSSLQAGLLIIGDEILSGAVSDSNAAWLGKLLHLRGVKLCRVEVVGDSEEEIVDSVHRIRERAAGGPVFTSGGIGPTHDDVTYAAIGAAFGRPLTVHEETLRRMTAHYERKHLEVNAMRRRMATLPEGAEVLFTDGMWVPLAIVEGVHILPGIPRLFQAMVSAHQERFQGKCFFSIHLYTNTGEGDLAALLAEISARNPQVRIGSYPKVTSAVGGVEGSDDDWCVHLVVEGRDEDDVRLASEEIRSSVRIINTITGTL